jgi:hypothetical protein
MTRMETRPEAPTGLKSYVPIKELLDRTGSTRAVLLAIARERSIPHDRRGPGRGGSIVFAPEAAAELLARFLEFHRDPSPPSGPARRGRPRKSAVA